MTKYLLALCLSTQVLTAWAQDDDATDADDEAQATEEEAADLGRVEVTGSLLKREDFTSTSPMQIIDAETQFQAGQLTAAEVLQNTTVAAGTTQLNNQFQGFVIQGGTGVETLDLRGLGTTRTLTLLNGRRPGGSGTRGQVQALDLSMIPDIAVTRYEIVLDGSSSIYGSDAVAGVANIITRRSVDRSEFNVSTEIPFESGGEWYRAGAITGLNFDNGSLTLSGQWTKREALTVADRDFLQCTKDLFTDSAGNNIDREDRSILAGTGLSCDANLYANTVIDALTGERFIPSPDGVEIGPVPGYRPRMNGRYDTDGAAWYEDVLNFPIFLEDSAINEQERVNIYATADFSFGAVDWDADFLYSNRNTYASGSRQFFPLIGGATVQALFGVYGYSGDPSFDLADENFRGALTQPVYPYPLNTEVDVDFYYFSTGLEGVFPTDNYWTWQVYGAYSRSEGDYYQNAIVADRSGDVRFDANPPTYNPFDPLLLSGQNMDELIATVGADTHGNTVYDQIQVTAIIAGDLFQLPAGTLGTAFGVEYRDFSIDDVPDELAQTANSWGLTSAIETTGSNSVWEAFLEAEVPLLAGLTGVEELTLNASARTFDYDRGGSDTVWKGGLRWQIVPSFALRGTVGTSYRAPALFEQFLGNQTSFAGQALDPCITWGESTNEFVRANCAAEGVPDDYDGVGSSIRVISGGGVDNLESETSDSMTFGFVWTPGFSDLSVAVDYYEIEVNDQIAQLGPTSIAQGCYGGENFPNAFCDLLVRIPGSDPVRAYQIETINDSFVNINSQRVEGVDLNVTWNGDFDWGTLALEGQSSFQFENIFQLFDPSQVSQFEDSDVIGEIGSPENVTNFRATASRDDWSVTYFAQYISETDRKDDYPEETTFFGFDPAYRDVTMDAVVYHNLSVLYQQDSWDVLLGVNNLLDDEPDTVSAGFVALRGNMPIVATQYDLLGRRVFARFNYRF